MVPQNPNPINKYNPPKIKNTFPILGHFFLTKNPIMVNKIGGPIIIVIMSVISPKKLPSFKNIIALSITFRFLILLIFFVCHLYKKDSLFQKGLFYYPY